MPRRRLEGQPSVQRHVGGRPVRQGEALKRVSSRPRPAWDPACSSGVRAPCGLRLQRRRAPEAAGGAERLRGGGQALAHQRVEEGGVLWRLRGARCQGARCDRRGRLERRSAAADRLVEE
eukprot:scaffold40355_cov57-Phaeocystis_antarctica.AAC.4